MCLWTTRRDAATGSGGTTNPSSIDMDRLATVGGLESLVAGRSGVIFTDVLGERTGRNEAGQAGTR